MINLTTGPVDITPEVVDALNSPVIGHRSAAFTHLYNEVLRKLCHSMDTSGVYIMTGSGTMANDAMLYQIKALNAPGLILVNGEFGNRLKNQAERLQIGFNAIHKAWGTAFEPAQIQQAVISNNAKWILCCHCETSTGQLTDLEMLEDIGQQYGVSIYLDCMSTFGTMPVSLKNMAMATASTAKGIGSLSGLSMVFSNIPLRELANVPVYLDLFYYQSCQGIPFTLSSNLIAGLNAALDLSGRLQQWQQTDLFIQMISERLHRKNAIPFAKGRSRVFTLVLQDKAAPDLGRLLLEAGIKTSFESSYLKERNWLQIALFSNYEQDEIEKTLSVIEGFLS